MEKLEHTWNCDHAGSICFSPTASLCRGSLIALLEGGEFLCIGLSLAFFTCRAPFQGLSSSLLTTAIPKAKRERLSFGMKSSPSELTFHTCP